MKKIEDIDKILKNIEQLKERYRKNPFGMAREFHENCIKNKYKLKTKN
tara:strand:- start:10949 stop:11092 length:144 start_codon:yes stop_codon:yes gene_type:complete